MMVLQQMQDQKGTLKEKHDEEMSGLVDKSMIDLLRACSKLPIPDSKVIDSKKVSFGPRTRQKTLILDMDETLVHTKFI